MSKFRIGDRVRMIETGSKYTNLYGKVVGFTGSGDYIMVKFDCNKEGHTVTFEEDFFELVKARPDTMLTEKIVTTTVGIETHCRPMLWAVVATSASSHNEKDYIMAQFNSHTDAEFFVKKLPAQGLEVRKIVKTNV